MSVEIVIGGPWSERSEQELRAAAMESLACTLEGRGEMYAIQAGECLVLAAIELAALRPVAAAGYVREAKVYSDGALESRKLAAQARARMVAG